MEAQAEPIVLIVREGALLSVVCARLTMAGETPITATNWLDPRLDPELREKALLVIESGFLPGEAGEGVRSLRDRGWSGKLAILVDIVPPDTQLPDVSWIPKRGGTAGVLAALSALREA